MRTVPRDQMRRPDWDCPVCGQIIPLTPILAGAKQVAPAYDLRPISAHIGTHKLGELTKAVVWLTGAVERARELCAEALDDYGPNALIRADAIMKALER